MNYVNEATEDYKEWSNFPTSPEPFTVSEADSASLALEKLIWDYTRAIPNQGGRPDGLTFHKFGSWKVEGTKVVAFCGNSYWAHCSTEMTPEISEAINRVLFTID